MLGYSDPQVNTITLGLQAGGQIEAGEQRGRDQTFFVHQVRRTSDSIDSQVLHPPSHSLRERQFSGTPLCGFERVTNETV